MILFRNCNEDLAFLIAGPKRPDHIQVRCDRCELALDGVFTLVLHAGENGAHVGATLDRFAVVRGLKNQAVAVRDKL